MTMNTTHGEVAQLRGTKSSCHFGWLERYDVVWSAVVWFKGGCSSRIRSVVGEVDRIASER